MRNETPSLPHLLNMVVDHLEISAFRVVKNDLDCDQDHSLNVSLIVLGNPNELVFRPYKLI
jgi:hypothetical protein